MAVTSQAGVFGFGAQSAKEAAASTIYKHYADSVDLDNQSDDRIGNPEVGGTPTPTFAYRAGVVSAGGALISPRLENTFGWLLYGLAGGHSVTSGEDVFEQTVATTFYHHEFTFSTVSAGFVPWMTFYKEIPGETDNDKLASWYRDSKIAGMTFALPNDAPMQARIDILGRGVNTQYESTTLTTYGNTQFEEYDSAALTCTSGGFIKVNNAELPVIAANVTVANAPLDIRQEKIIGSPYLRDITVVSRQLAFDLIVQWEDPELFREIFTGSTTGTTWSPKVFTSDLDLYVLSADHTPNSVSPYQFRIVVPKAMFRLVGGVQLAGANALSMRLQGTAIKGTQAYYTLHLGNEQPTYVWPT